MNYETKLRFALYTFIEVMRIDFDSAQLVQEAHESLPSNSSPILFFGDDYA